MGYFSNGTEGEIYQATYCHRCINDANSNCPVLALHLVWNYEALDNPDKANALNMFIPRGKSGNLECRMFIPTQAAIQASERERLAAWNRGEPKKVKDK